MKVTAIDTHAVVKRLMAAGVTDAQAEAVTLAVRDARDIDLSNLATKAVLAATRADLEKTIANVKVEILKRMVVALIGIQTVVIIGAVPTLVRTLRRVIESMPLAKGPPPGHDVT